MTVSKSIVKILFPHTYLSRNRWEKLNSYFGRISLYQPDTFHIPPSVQKMSDQGLLEIRIPITEKQEELRSIRSAFLQWADLQGSDLGAAAAYHRFLDAGAEGGAPDSVAEIRDRILQNTKEKRWTGAEDPFIRARLFLVIAQDFDLHQETIDSDFVRIHQMEAEMQDAISGRLVKSAPFVPKAESDHDFMAADRLRAWVPILYRDYLDNNDGDFPVVFVASCRGVLNTILAPSPECVRIVALDDIVGPDDSSLNTALFKIIRADGYTSLPGTLLKDNGSDIDNLDAPVLLFFPDTHPLDFFLRFSRFDFDSKALLPFDMDRIRHTVVLYIP